jgi:hypothetical protein
MGLLDWLRNRFSPTRIEDPVFGSILDMGGYWEGKGHFPPTRGTIEWFVEADALGPGEAQRDALRAIVERYPSLEPAVHELLRREIAAWSEGTSSHPRDGTTLAWISVPAQLSAAMEWEIGFESTIEGTPHFTVHLVGWQPTGEVGIDT